MAITFPDIDPVIISVGPLAIRWYALSYVAGILIGWMYLAKLNKKSPSPLSTKAYDDIMVWAIIGIILGGRIGYILFYNIEFYLQSPLDILKIWEGGMSFHGGLIGVISAMILMCRKYKLQFLPIADMLCCIAPIGLFFGRIANFINAELIGRYANENLPWAVIFPGDYMARHPSQLYEAILEGLVLFIIINYLFWRRNIRNNYGALSGVFLIGYAIFRAFIEQFRQPDTQLGLFFNQFTMGQFLCVPMALIGIFLIIRSSKNTPNNS